MASTTIQDVTVRPLSAPLGAIKALYSTNLSTSSTATGRTIALGTAAYAISAQAIVSTGGSPKVTFSIDGSLNPSGGWTALKSTTWTTTQAGTVRLVQGASTSAKPVTHLRVRITDVTTTASTGLGDATVWLGVV